MQQSEFDRVIASFAADPPRREMPASTLVMPAAVAARDIQQSYQAALAAKLQDDRPGHIVGDAHGLIPLGEQWLNAVIDFANLLREAASDEALRPAAQIAADLYGQSFPGVATKPVLHFLMADDDKITAHGPYGVVEIRIDAAAADALTAAAQAFLDALPQDHQPA